MDGKVETKHGVNYGIEGNPDCYMTSKPQLTWLYRLYFEYVWSMLSSVIWFGLYQSVMALTFLVTATCLEVTNRDP